jgi:hypothetical protein
VNIVEQIEGAQILSAEVDEGEEGIHLYLSNGMCVILIGIVGLLRTTTEKLH